MKPALLDPHYPRRVSKELIRAGCYLAEVAVELEYSDEVWLPTMSVDDARKLQRVCRALRRGDHGETARDAKLYELLPLAG